MKQLVRISLCGDVMIGRLFNGILGRNPSFNVWGNMRSHISKSDLLVMNLETTITDSTVKYPNKMFNYRASPTYANTVLNVAKQTYCSIANNHILDFKEKGVSDTMQYLKRNRLSYGGAGLTLSNSQRLTIIPLKGTDAMVKVGILSAADHYSYWAASDITPGIWYIDTSSKRDISEALRIVKSAKKRCDLLIFSCHMQPNYVNTVSKDIQHLYRRLIDSGVDIVHGHSPHHLLPIEKYGNGYIFYSLGDLIDDYAINQKYMSDLSVIIDVIVDVSDATIRRIVKRPTRNIHIRSSLNGEYTFQTNFSPIGSKDYKFVMDVLHRSSLSEVF